jgi:hypothetical protein
MRWRLLLVLSAFLSGLSCGGRSIRHGSGGEAGEDPEGAGAVGGTTGGTTGGRNVTGGTGAGAFGGGGGSAGDLPITPTLCHFDGLVLAVGQSTEDVPLCRTCTCQADGDVDCTQCDATCRVSATEISVGQSILMPDGCTSCICTIDGMDCNSSSCEKSDPCRDLVSEYELAVGAERWCGPRYGNFNCTSALRIAESIPCGCSVLVRSVEAATNILDRYVDMGCPAAPICESMCQEPRPPYRCSEAGFCIGGI